MIDYAEDAVMMQMEDDEIEAEAAEDDNDSSGPRLVFTIISIIIIMRMKDCMFLNEGGQKGFVGTLLAFKIFQDDAVINMLKSKDSDSARTLKNFGRHIKN